jgi:hypothetical protein
MLETGISFAYVVKTSDQRTCLRIPAEVDNGWREGKRNRTNIQQMLPERMPWIAFCPQTAERASSQLSCLEITIQRGTSLPGWKDNSPLPSLLDNCGPVLM